MRIARIVTILILIGFTFLIIWNYSSPSTPFPPGPLPPPPFLGYGSSNITRIDERINLTGIMRDAKSAGYTVVYQDYISECPENYEIYIETYMEGPVEGSGLLIAYDKTENLTHFSYIFPAYTKGAYEWMWNKLTYYMHTEISTLNNTIQNAMYNEDGGEGFISGEPDWDDIKRDLGSLTTSDSREIGYIREQYSSGREIKYGTPRIIIKTEKFVSLNFFRLSVELEIHLDEDGDIYLSIGSKEKLPDPLSLFTQLFESINLPLSTLNEIKLQEVYAAYV